MGCDSFIVGQQVIKCESGIQVALTIPKSFNMTHFQVIAENADQLTQRLYCGSGVKIFIYKRVDSEICDLNESLFKNIQFVFGGFRESTLFLMKFLCYLGKVHCMVAETLKVTDRMQELGCLLCLIRCQIMHT